MRNNTITLIVILLILALAGVFGAAATGLASDILHGLGDLIMVVARTLTGEATA